MNNRQSRAFWFIALLVAFFFLFDPFNIFGNRTNIPRPAASRGTVNELEEWVGTNAVPPVDYLVSQFQDHRIIFLGEMGRVREQIQVVIDAIPALYNAGIRHLGVGFALSDDQDRIDELITGEEFDDALAHSILFDRMVVWGFEEYVDVFRAAWEINRNLPEGTPPFRIVGLEVDQDYSHIVEPEDAEDPEKIRQVFAEGLPDVHMANVIREEFLATGNRALIYVGMQHAHTEFRNRAYAERAEELNLGDSRRVGNIIYDQIGDDAVTVLIHTPWGDDRSQNGMAYPAGGALDALLEELPAERRAMGFDVDGTPFAELPVYAKSLTEGYDRLSFSEVTDGYITVELLTDYEPATPIEGFITDENFDRAVSNFPGPTPQDENLSPAQMNEYIQGLAQSITRLFESFE